MKIRLRIAAANIGFMFLLVGGIAAQAAEVKVLSSNQMKTVMEDLGPKFERATGHQLAITFAGLGAVVKRVKGGETADVVITLREGIDSIVKDGKAAAGNVTVVARSRGLGVAVRKGAPKPDISSPEALKRTLLAAKSITYGNPAGVVGIQFAKVLDRLGIANEMKPKTVFYPGGAGEAVAGEAVGILVANGKVEIGVFHFHELIPVAGIELVGPLPGDLQEAIVLSAAIMTGAKDAGASKALVDFLRTPEAATVIKAKGMEPATP
ncbi:MAG: substrate-binding domain-containing protein [Betaproteobacteria bacterium]|nr:substrate-binding domain-containing protein [Betaproteobacteria bacterium]